MGSAPSSNSPTSSNVTSRCGSPASNGLELNGSSISRSPYEETILRVYKLLNKSHYHLSDMLRVCGILNDCGTAERLELIKYGILDEILAKIYERSKIDMYRSMCIGDLGNKASSYNSLDPAENVRRDRTNLLKANTIRNKTTIQFSQSMKRSKGSNLVYATNLLKLKRTKSDNKNGVGYGTGSTRSIWNIRQTLEEKLIQEEHLMWLLTALTSLLWGEHLNTEIKKWQILCRDEQDTQRLRSFCFRKEIPEYLNENIARTIANSAVIPLLAMHLNNDSVFDISQRLDFYQAIIELTAGLCLFPSFLPNMVIRRNEDVRSIAKELVPRFRDTLNAYPLLIQGRASPDLAFIEFIRHMNALSEVIISISRHYELSLPPEKRVRTAYVHYPAGLKTAIPEVINNRRPTNDRSDIASSADISRSSIDIFEVVEPIDNQQLKKSGLHAMRTESSPITALSFLSVNSEEDIASYADFLKDYQTTTYKLLDNDMVPLYGFAFKKELRNINPCSSSNKERTKRIAKELASMHNALPLNSSNSIFICMDESRCDMLKVLISGPDDTPYQNGLFEFDVFFPSNYPVQPPKCSFLTTGAGTVRFNPNLYNDGKICLSILGTWEGRPEEKWNPLCSLLQVLVSIQGLIFVKKPYFNEPGYEKTQGTLKGEEYSKKYNLYVKNATLAENWLHEMAMDVNNNSATDKEKDSGFMDSLFPGACFQRHSVRKLIEEFTYMVNPVSDE